MRRLIVWLIVTIVLLAAASAQAKGEPYLEPLDSDYGDLSAPVEVWSAEAFVMQYARLGVYGDVDAYTLTFEDGQTNWPISLQSAYCGEHATYFYPSVAIIGPGLDAPEADTLPFELPEGIGAQVFATTDDPAKPHQAIQLEFNNLYYDPLNFLVDIPAAGTYTLAVWEPNGVTGGYTMTTGSQHDLFSGRTIEEMDAVWAQIMDTDTSWTGQDCDAPLAAESCLATRGESSLAGTPETEARSHVGEGFVLTGTVRDTATCMPIMNAEITYWLVNEQGEYDAAHEGILVTNAQGVYRLESNRPGSYGPTGHIHLAIRAEGYSGLVTAYELSEEDVESALFDINIAPA